MAQINENITGKYITYPKPYPKYGSVEFTMSSGIVDYDLAANTDLFDNLTVAIDTLIRVPEGSVGVKLNEATNPEITIDSTQSISLNNFSVENIFITASGSFTIRILTGGYR